MLKETFPRLADGAGLAPRRSQCHCHCGEYKNRQSQCGYPLKLCLPETYQTPESKKGHGTWFVLLSPLLRAAQPPKTVRYESLGYAPVKRRPGRTSDESFSCAPRLRKHLVLLYFAVSDVAITQLAWRPPMPQTTGSSSLPSHSGLAGPRVTSFARFRGWRRRAGAWSPFA